MDEDHEPYDPYELEAWAWRTRTGNAERKLVLLALAVSADNRGLVTADPERLAAALEMHVGEVKGHLEGLAAADLLELIEDRPGTPRLRLLSP